MCETFFVLLLRVKTVPTLEPMFICTYMLPNPKHHLNWPRSSIEGLLSNEVFIKHVNTIKQVKQIIRKKLVLKFATNEKSNWKISDMMVSY